MNKIRDLQNLSQDLQNLLAVAGPIQAEHLSRFIAEIEEEISNEWELEAERDLT